MSDLFHHLGRDLHAGEQYASDWFHRHARHDSSPAIPGDTISAGETQAPPALGVAVSLTDVVAAFKTDLEDGETKIRTVLDEHVPALVALAEKVSNDPLIQAAEAAALPPGAKQLVAEFITKLAATFPPAPVEAAPEPAEPQAA